MKYLIYLILIRGLNAEYSSKGIIVQSLCPYFVSTKLSAMRSSLMAPKPNVYVNEALKTIGSQSVTNGCLIHNFQVCSLKFKFITLKFNQGWYLRKVS